VVRHKEHTDVGDHCESELDYHVNLGLNTVPRLHDHAWNRLILFAHCILMSDNGDGANSDKCNGETIR